MKKATAINSDVMEAKVNSGVYIDQVDGNLLIAVTLHGATYENQFSIADVDKAAVYINDYRSLEWYYHPMVCVNLLGVLTV